MVAVKVTLKKAERKEKLLSMHVAFDKTAFCIEMERETAISRRMIN